MTLIENTYHYIIKMLYTQTLLALITYIVT